MRLFSTSIAFALLVLASAAAAMPISGDLTGFGFYVKQQDGEQITYQFERQSPFGPSGSYNPSDPNYVPPWVGAYAGPVNTEAFSHLALMAPVEVGNIVINGDGNTAVANDWVIDTFRFVIDTVTVFNHDAGHDFLLKGIIFDTAEESVYTDDSPFKIFLEANAAYVYTFATVPEPSTIALMVIGVIGLIAHRRRLARTR